MKELRLPLTQKDLAGLTAGDELLLSGTLYTARDQAHKRIAESIRLRKRLPIGLAGAAMYYCGPTKTPKGRAIGSCGPTTSSRMDSFTPALLKVGLRVMIGKGDRSEAVRSAIKRHKAVYFLAYAGCGALIAGYVTGARPVAFKDLGPEAVYRLEVRGFPVIVGIDAKGRSIYDSQ